MLLYLWSNESEPPGPVRVHIAEEKAVSNPTKVWVTGSGKALLCNNNSRIPDRILARMLCIIEANSGEFVQAWIEHFGEISYYC